MKKVLSLFGFMIMLPLCANAEVYETTTVDDIGKQGYSQSMLRTVDTTLKNHQSHQGNYKKVYNKKSGINFIGKAYTRIKIYFDPAQDDGNFGEREVNFTNNWMGDSVRYNYPTEDKNNRIEDL